MIEHEYVAQLFVELFEAQDKHMYEMETERQRPQFWTLFWFSFF